MTDNDNLTASNHQATDMGKHPHLVDRRRTEVITFGKTNPFNLPCHTIPSLLNPSPLLHSPPSLSWPPISPKGPKCAVWGLFHCFNRDLMAHGSLLPCSCLQGQELLPPLTAFPLLPQQHFCRGEIVSSESPRLSISEAFACHFFPLCFLFFSKSNPKTMGFGHGWLKHSLTKLGCTGVLWAVTELDSVDANYTNSIQSNQTGGMLFLSSWHPHFKDKQQEEKKVQRMKTWSFWRFTELLLCIPWIFIHF